MGETRGYAGVGGQVWVSLCWVYLRGSHRVGLGSMTKSYITVRDMVYPDNAIYNIIYILMLIFSFFLWNFMNRSGAEFTKHY